MHNRIIQTLEEENMSEFNFKSAICTNHQQSEKLLSLGLKKETADMYWTKVKKGYPKTYEECRDYLESCYDEPFCADLVATGYKSKLIESFARLLICRDAYWKIAGEEMRLGKPWEPDLEGEGWYVIINYRGDIVTDVQWHTNAILAFPTEEMRDEFKENFSSDIDICKPLL